MKVKQKQSRMVLLFYIFLNLKAIIDSVSLTDVKNHIIYKYCFGYCILFVLLAKQYILCNNWSFYSNCFQCTDHQECREGHKTYSLTPCTCISGIVVCLFLVIWTYNIVRSSFEHDYFGNSWLYITISTGLIAGIVIQIITLFIHRP